MKHIFHIMLSSLLMALMAACNEQVPVPTLEPEPAGHPSGCTPGHEAGVSAPFCGILDRCPVFAGGANFPEIPAKDGGIKRFYSDILRLKDGQWEKVGELPKTAAYGGCLRFAEHLILIGGNDGNGALSEVYTLRITDGKAEITSCTPMLYGIEQAGYAIEGNRLFVTGGMSEGKPSAKVLSGIINEDEIIWEEIAEMPEFMVQPVAFAHNGRLYVWGGFDPAGKTVSTDGWYLDLTTGQWRESEGCPDGKTLSGASGTVLGNGHLAVIGGVDNDIFSRGINAGTAEEKLAYMSMEVSEYKFNASLRTFDPETEKWTIAGKAPQLALAGAGIAADGSSIYIIGGELKPGIRTPDTWKLKTPTK